MVGKLYRELVSVLSWLALGSCPNIMFAMGMLTHFDHNPGCTHQEMAKRVLHYLKGMRGWHLTLGGNQLEVSAYTEADWATIMTIGAQSEHILSRSVVEQLVGSPRNMHA